MEDDRPDVGGTDGDLRLKRYIRAASAAVCLTAIMAWVFVPSLRFSEITLGLFVGGALILGGISSDSIPWLGGGRRK